jgi:hypothetical protein
LSVGDAPHGSPASPPRAEELRFDRAEYAEEPAETSCARCGAAIAGEYFNLRGAVLCGACRGAIVAADTAGGGSSLLRALLLGAGAAGLGSAIYYAIRALTGYEIGLVAIVVGLIVGGAVKKGSGGRGGRRYQALAVALTYFAIVTTYIPDILRGLSQRAATEAASAAPAPDAASFLLALLVLCAIACAAPFLAGFENIIGLLIIGFALFEAWRINKRVPLDIAGPFRVAAGSDGSDRPPSPAASTARRGGGPALGDASPDSPAPDEPAHR